MITPIPGSILDDDYPMIPIRMVNSLVYCPREAWYQFTLNEDPLNVHMERGLRRHGVFAEAETTNETGLVIRHLPVAAPQLGVAGILDEVVLSEDATTIVEYKTARAPRAVWDGIAMQVVVQALALREHAASDRWHGPPVADHFRLRVYFSDSRRYRDVAMTAEAERRARDCIRQAQRILTLAVPPPGNVGPRCRACQHESACLPFDLPAWNAAASEATEERTR